MMLPTCRVEGRDRGRRQTIFILPTSGSMFLLRVNANFWGTYPPETKSQAYHIRYIFSITIGLFMTIFLANDSTLHSTSASSMILSPRSVLMIEPGKLPMSLHPIALMHLGGTGLAHHRWPIGYGQQRLVTAVFQLVV